VILARRFGAFHRPFSLIFALLSVLALLIAAAAYWRFGPGSAGAAGPRLTFREHEHDFGQVTSGANAEDRFTFTNTGDQPLEISVHQPQATAGGG
jgi:hypothetical protein